MTLNDLERRNSSYFAFFTEFDCFAGQIRRSGWISTYNVRKYCLPDVKYFTRSTLREVCHVYSNSTILCPEKRDKYVFFVISPIKLRLFWRNFVRSFLNKYKFAAKWCKHFPPRLNTASTHTLWKWTLHVRLRVGDLPLYSIDSLICVKVSLHCNARLQAYSSYYMSL